MENSCQWLIISDEAEMFPKQVPVVKMIYAKYDSRFNRLEFISAFKLTILKHKQLVFLVLTHCGLVCQLQWD